MNSLKKNINKNSMKNSSSKIKSSIKEIFKINDNILSSYLNAIDNKNIKKIKSLYKKKIISKKILFLNCTKIIN